MHVVIKTVPNANNLLTLCNGWWINAEYAPGTTLTIPYLAGKDVMADANNMADLVIDNNYVQKIPYNPLTGTWDLSTTPLQEFVDGNVISIQAELPLLNVS